MRLWILVSGFDDAAGLRRLCESVRRFFPSADSVPIVYADGAYAKFPHERPQSKSDVFEVANRFASLIVDWPVPAPTEFIKRSSYWIGKPGDYVLILDSDEELVECPAFEQLKEMLDHSSYKIPIAPPDGLDSWAHRLFQVRPNGHHWGSHESVFFGHDQQRRIRGKRFDKIKVLNHPAAPARQEKKILYYKKGIHRDERRFRKTVGV